jgi:hypothetical protein
MEYFSLDTGVPLKSKNQLLSRSIKCINVRDLNVKTTTSAATCLSHVRRLAAHLKFVWFSTPTRYNVIITYYIPSAKIFIGNFFANERKHPQMRSEDQLLANKSTRRKFCTWDIICDYCTCTF